MQTFYCEFSDNSRVSAEYNSTQWSKEELRDIQMLLWAPTLLPHVDEIEHDRLRDKVWEWDGEPKELIILKRMDKRRERHFRYFFDACKRMCSRFSRTVEPALIIHA